MTEPKGAGKRIVEESNPVGFARKLKGLPLPKKILRILDRFL